MRLLRVAQIRRPLDAKSMYREVFGCEAHDFVDTAKKAFGALARQPRNQIGIDDRNAAEAAKGTELFITEEDLPELPEGQFYIRDLIGMEVEEQGGSFHGVVTDVLQNTAQDIFEVKRDDGKTVLIPKVDAFVQKIDGKERLITVTLIEGLTDL